MNTEGKLLRYSASAGSGKTHALTGFYLSRILYDPSAYRRILAVTFTNSAAAEMKNRILTRLNDLGDAGDDNKERAKSREEFVEYVCGNFPELYPDKTLALAIIKRNAPLALKNILQDYSRFTVGTIDSFFQRVIRAFAREIDIPAGYEIEIEHDILLGNAVDELLHQVASDSKLRGWITAYITSRLDVNRNWDVRREIMEVAGQIFGEQFRQLGREDRSKLGDYDILQKYTEKIFVIKNSFESELKKLASEGVSIYRSCGMVDDDFSSKSKGVGEWLGKYACGTVKKPNTIWDKAVEENKFITKDADVNVRKALAEALEKGLGEKVSAISSLFEARYPLYLAAVAQIRTIHVMGILGVISEKVRSLAHDENLFLLSDSGELINKLIAADDTPFIYEKIGTTYDHFIIDEFQDTSRIQWQNFMPLIRETLSRGKDNLVVGDVKQSIYRWRNSDWRILYNDVEAVFGPEMIRTIPLNTNFRSRMNIIRFNNFIFRPEGIPSLCDSKLNVSTLSLKSVYQGSEQEGAGKKNDGYVRVSLYKLSDEEKWKESVLRDLPALIEEMQDHGYHASDIMFLCRTNGEGKSIVNRILEYSAVCDSDRLLKYNFEVTSGESLYLERNPAVTLLLSCLRYITDPSNRVNISLMVRSYSLAVRKDESVLYSADTLSRIPDEVFPGGWTEMLGEVRNTSLFSATERMIEFFGLGNERSHAAYISSFQDVVLWYSSRYSSDISSFVSWWESEGNKKTIAQSDHQEAMRVMTIHKAKGLQSKVVIVPFASWEFSRHGLKRPLLWIRKVPGDFSPMPVILPELTSLLEDSLFSEEAKNERASEWLDGLNLLYVAFTRPVDVLLVMAPEDKKQDTISSSTGSLLNNALRNGIDDVTWTENEVCRTLSVGSLPPVEERQVSPVVMMSEYMVSQRRGTMRLRTGGALPLDEIKLEEPGGRAYGIMMHELLGRVETLSDIPAAVEYVIEKGLLQTDLRAQLTEKITGLLSSGKVRQWFDGSSAVRSEATIILPTGAARRPDRIMEHDGKITVVDYKFGEESEKHVRQAGEYRDLLRKMGCNDVKAWIWYVEKDLIREA